MNQRRSLRLYMYIFFSIIIASIFVSAIALSGAALFIYKRLLSERVTSYLVSFAAGILLATAFFDLLPEAVHQLAERMEIDRVFLFTFFGIVSFFFLERFVLWFHHHDESHGAKPSAVLILFGDALHNFIDGVAIAAAYLTNPSLGLSTMIAIAVHEAPAEISDLSILIASGMKKSRALFFNYLSGLTALLGAILGFFFLKSLEGLLPLALAFTAGMFIYIACADLIPDLHKEFKRQKSWAQSIPFILGIFTTWAMVKLLEG